jgi:MFS family permease
MNAGNKMWTLIVVSTAQLLIVLDGTIVNIALPSAQQALGVSDSGRQWVITAYALAFGGLLLVGGRISGALGHRRAFAVGLLGFAAASALGGLAVTPEMLFAARAFQGAFAALLAPAGLAVLANTFTGGRAFGVFAAVGAAGSAVGLVAGGLLTQYATWRWCLLVNVPIAVLALLGCVFVRADRPTTRTRLGLPGAVLSVGGVAALVYAASSPQAIALAAVGVVLLGLFVLVEKRAANPLLPLRVLANRTRAIALGSIFLTFAVMFGFYLHMTYYLQSELRLDPVQAGLMLLINAIAALVSATLIRLSPQKMLVVGVLLVVAGMFVGNVPLALVLTGLGLGCVLPATTRMATAGLSYADIGPASAAYNATQQLGAALGTALLNTILVS